MILDELTLTVHCIMIQLVLNNFENAIGLFFFSETAGKSILSAYTT